MGLLLVVKVLEMSDLHVHLCNIRDGHESGRHGHFNPHQLHALLLTHAHRNFRTLI